MEIPEEQQATALRQLAEVSSRRLDALAEVNQLTAELKDAAVHAASVGASRTRIRGLAKVSGNKLYAWYTDAGLDVRPARGGRHA